MYSHSTHTTSNNRDCFTLVRPMHDEAALSAMDTLPREQLRPEFKQVGVGA